MTPTLVALVQRYYPKIYIACHVDHVRRRSTVAQVSSHDSALLAHLDMKKAVSASSLARHLGITASTLSAAVTRLRRLGYVEVKADPDDRRVRRLTLTASGQRAMERTSVLDARRVRGLLSELTDSQQKRAVAGLELLARAALATTHRRLRGTAK